MTDEKTWAEKQFTVTLDRALMDKVRAHRARMELSTGLRVSMSAAYRQLLERGLRETERKLGDGRKR